MHIRAVVLHSGGLDSSVCLLQALEHDVGVLSLGIDYGQRHRIELDFAANQCRKLGVARKVLRIEWDKPQLFIPEERKISEMSSTISPAFLPGRNVVFLTLACAEAAGVGAAEVWIGVNAIDFSGYPDCRPEFVNAFQSMLSLAMPGGPSVITPLLHLTKPEIAREAHRLGLTPGETWSCYQPRLGQAGVVPCGKCDACILHEHAWKSFDFPQPRT